MDGLFEVGVEAEDLGQGYRIMSMGKRKMNQIIFSISLIKDKPHHIPTLTTLSKAT